MYQTPKIVEKSDSIIDLLAAQCSDLEKLLAIAREETRAAESQDFEAIFEIVSERAKIGERLEVFQQRISELRVFLGENVDAKRNELANRITEIAALTMAQDQKTRLLLTESKEKSADELRSLENSNRSVNLYMSESRRGLAYSQNF